MRGSAYHPQGAPLFYPHTPPLPAPSPLHLIVRRVASAMSGVSQPSCLQAGVVLGTWNGSDTTLACAIIDVRQRKMTLETQFGFVQHIVDIKTQGVMVAPMRLNMTSSQEICIDETSSSHAAPAEVVVVRARL